MESLPFGQNPMVFAYGEAYIVGEYIKRIESGLKCEKTKAVFRKIGQLGALYMICERKGDFRRDGLLSSE